ncbi:MAG: hydantoinase/oxoprolinase N-terminal domain-containing protein, partial [Gammaproteobacteria bacterium]|nr:hydantoinase/oxoprolinase N-terminal domain-containing protein [Gammaproteobacteria bacterium]
MRYRLGVDVGGTFTDLLVFDETSRKMTLTKVPTTVDNQAVGIVSGINKIAAQAGISPVEIRSIMHGTTAGTNAVLENKGAHTALIVTEGFRDVLHIMRQDRPRLYDFFAGRPQPLIERRLRFELPERILHTGQVHKTLDKDKLDRIIRKIRQQKVKAVAVCFLHSYVNDIHEQQVREALLDQCPDLCV